MPQVATWPASTSGDSAASAAGRSMRPKRAGVGQVKNQEVISNSRDMPAPQVLAIALDDGPDLCNAQT